MYSSPRLSSTRMERTLQRPRVWLELLWTYGLLPEVAQESGLLHFIDKAVVVKRFRRRARRRCAINETQVGHESDHRDDRFFRDRRIFVERLQAEAVGALEGLRVGLAGVLGKNLLRQRLLNRHQLHPLQGRLDQAQHQVAIFCDERFPRGDALRNKLDAELSVVLGTDELAVAFLR